MKVLNVIETTLILSSITLIVQKCKVYLPNTIWTEVELTNYDKKHKPSLKDIKQSGDTTIYYLQQLLTDNKGKNPVDNNFSFKWLGEIFYIDMDICIDQKTMEAYKHLEMKVTTSEIDIPSKMVAGQKIKDGCIKIAINMGMITLQTARSGISKILLLQPALLLVLK